MGNKDLKINPTAKGFIERIAQVCREKKPVVAIRCVTYNHEAYLREALEGFVMQQTDFPFVAIVHDDASTDNTAAILKEYADKYPGIILPIFETENQYSKRNDSLDLIMLKACEATGAKYISICEGDDYWTDKLKLQKQVDFLESNPEYGMCYALTHTWYEATDTLEEVAVGSDRCSFNDLLTGENDIPNLTTLLKSRLYYDYFYEVGLQDHKWETGDLPNWLYVSKKSKIKCLPEVVAVYRVLNKSISHTGSLKGQMSFYQSAVDIKHFFNTHYNNDDLKTKRLINFRNMQRLIICYHLYDPALKPMVQGKATELDLSPWQKFIVKMCLLPISHTLMRTLITTGSRIKRSIR